MTGKLQGSKRGGKITISILFSHLEGHLGIPGCPTFIPRSPMALSACQDQEKQCVSVSEAIGSTIPDLEHFLGLKPSFYLVYDIALLRLQVNLLGGILVSGAISSVKISLPSNGETFPIFSNRNSRHSKGHPGIVSRCRFIGNPQNIFMYIYIYIHVCVHVYTCVCMYVCIYIYYILYILYLYIIFIYYIFFILYIYILYYIYIYMRMCVYVIYIYTVYIYIWKHKRHIIT